MFKKLNALLFATDLTENCRDAFTLAASLATRYKATLVLLHVMEKMPVHLEGQLQGLFGEKEWAKIRNDREYDAWEDLIGKKANNHVIREALQQFCTLEGIDDASCDYKSREIVVSKGELVDEIIDTSQTYNCDLIVLGASHGLISKTAIGSTIKTVLRRSYKPVMVVPPERYGSSSSLPA
jgi:nucleotide-binding universal stress UspA family protein